MHDSICKTLFHFKTITVILWFQWISQLSSLRHITTHSLSPVKQFYLNIISGSKELADLPSHMNTFPLPHTKLYLCSHKYHCHISFMWFVTLQNLPKKGIQGQEGILIFVWHLQRLKLFKKIIFATEQGYWEIYLWQGVIYSVDPSHMNCVTISFTSSWGHPLKLLSFFSHIFST